MHTVLPCLVAPLEHTIAKKMAGDKPVFHFVENALFDS